MVNIQLNSDVMGKKAPVTFISVLQADATEPTLFTKFKPCQMPVWIGPLRNKERKKGVLWRSKTRNLQASAEKLNIVWSVLEK